MHISFKIFHALMLIYNNGINIIIFIKLQVESPLMATLFITTQNLLTTVRDYGIIFKNKTKEVYAMYAFPVGLIVGRFQVFHKGH